MVHPQVRNSIPHQQIEPAESLADKVQQCQRPQQAQIAEHDQLGVLALEQRARGVEMVDTSKPAVALSAAAALGLALVIVVARDVGKQVHGPAEQLLQDEVQRRLQRGLLHELSDLMHGFAQAAGVLLACLGHPDHVPAEIARCLVVLAVRDLPREVRHQQQGVADETNRVVERLGRRKRLMPALVRQHPQTRPEQALQHRVHRPQQRPQRQTRHRLRRHIVVEHVERAAQEEHVPCNVVQPLGC